MTSSLFEIHNYSRSKTWFLGRDQSSIALETKIAKDFEVLEQLNYEFVLRNPNFDRVPGLGMRIAAIEISPLFNLY